MSSTPMMKDRDPVDQDARILREREALDKLTNGQGFHERLPMLDVVVDRLTRLLAASARQFTSRTTRVQVVSHEVRRFEEALAALPPRGIIAVTSAQPWDGKLLLAANSDVIFALVEVLLGGHQRPFAVDENRTLTSIERRLAQRILDLTASMLADAFSPVSDVQFRNERIETNAEFVAICREGTPCVVVTLRLDFEKVGGTLSLLLPYPTLDPVRKRLVQIFANEKFGRDPVWERHLRSEVNRTELDVVGVLHEQTVTLGDIARWKPGMTITLPITVKKPAARLVCNGIALYDGAMGQSNGSIAVRIETPVQVDEEILDALVSR